MYIFEYYLFLSLILGVEEHMKHICPICGYKGLDEQAYYDLSKFDGGSFEICECCRFQFGVDDDVEMENGEFLTAKDAHKIYRNIWLNLGSPVFMTEHYPPEYQENGKVKKEYLVKQLKNIGLSSE